MAKGQLVISIDLELAWGVWDHVTPEDLRLAAAEERPICATLIELFDRHQIPVTWAMVAALLDEPSAASQPGTRECWYAPDVVERIVGAKAGHEIGSHGGHHRYFNALTAAQAREDLEFARDLHRAHKLPFESFVFPRNSVGQLEILRGAGLRTYRGPDLGWLMAAGNVGRIAGRIMNLADKSLPIPPTPAFARQDDAGLIDIPGSMLLLGRNGVRRFVLSSVTRAKLAMGLARARRSNGIFHLWFHPSNFYYRREEQFATLAWFLEHAAEEAGRGHIEIRTMGACARNFATAGAGPARVLQ